MVRIFGYYPYEESFTGYILMEFIVLCGYNYKANMEIPCSVVENFLAWFEAATSQSQELVLANIVSKLSTIYYEEPEPELPF